MTRMKYVLAFIAFALTTLLSGGCSGSKEQVLVWPDPPDEARVQYVRTLRGEEDFRGAMGKALSEVAGEQNVIHLSRPYDVCVAGGGRVYVTDVSQGVFLFDLEKGEVEVLGEKSSIDLRNPRGIAYGKGNVFLSLPDLGQVLVLDDEGKDLRTIGARGQFTGLVDVVCDTARNRLILVDNKLHNVLVYSMAGDSLFELGTRGEGDGQFNYPQSAAVDKDGNIYVVDAFNFRVEIFDAAGKYLRQFGSQGDKFGMFNRPKGIALDSFGNIYVLDALHQNFQIFNQEAQLLMFVGKYSPGNDGFVNPVSIAIDGKNTIYVTDQLNGRVQVFKVLKAD
jgi:DNA-binding beta-propeller fold protein YncE